MTDRTHPDSGRIITSSDVIADLQDRIAELEAELEAVGAGGVQALSAAPAVPNGDELRRIARSARTSASDDASPTEYVLAGWKAAMLAASPTPPAEQQAQPGAVDRTGCTAGTDEECTRRGCATTCPALQAAPKAAPQQEAQEPAAYVEVSQSDAEVSMTWGPEPAGVNLPTGRYALYTAPQPAPAPAPLSRNQIREVFIAHGFTIKEGQTDLKQYVYDAAHELLELVAAPQQEGQEPVWDGKLSDAMRNALDALYLQCGHEIARDISHQVRKECEAIYTSYTTAKRMYQAARDRLGAIETAQPQPDPFAAPQPAPAPLSDDAKDAARYRWLRDEGFTFADVDLGVDSNGDDFVAYRIRFHLPEPAHSKFEDAEWTGPDIDAAIDAALAAQGGK